MKGPTLLELTVWGVDWRVIMFASEAVYMEDSLSG